MLGLSVRAMMQVGYESAGTLEFLVDLKTGQFYFIEMNTRLQVEHTITEMVTGIDIVETMIRVAMGEPLPFTQNEVTFRGYAMEFRINAEDPRRNFAPAPGKITAYYSPGGPGVRMDAGVYKDYVIPPYYDSMIAKLSVWALNLGKAFSEGQKGHRRVYSPWCSHQHPPPQGDHQGPRFQKRILWHKVLRGKASHLRF
jgi:pyruvate carboxylase subunit A